jgi:glycosyltransferase involved in cell wall biosynthesis
VGICAPAGGDLEKLADELGVSSFDVSMTGATAKKAIRSALEDFRPDIMHAHGSRAALFTRLADRKGAQRCVVTLHGLAGAHGTTAPIKRLLERSQLHNTVHFITVCEANHSQAASLGILDPAKTTVVYNGIELLDDLTLAQAREDRILSRMADVDEDTPILLHVGRISKEKNQRNLLKAFSWLHVRRPDANLVMICAGRDRERTALQKYAEKIDIASAIKWLEPQSNLTDLYASCDAFVLPSLWEGLPYTVIEAMAAGAIVVASNVDGIPEAVIDAKTGFLVSPKNPESLSEKLEDALNLTKTQRKQMQENARAAVQQRFMLDDMINKTIAVYEKVMKEHS